jgi:AMIN domain-containing protein
MRAKLELILAALLLIGSAAAQGNAPGEIRDLAVMRSGNATQVQVNLSAPAQPRVIVATNPPRLVLEFATTLPGDKQGQIAVGQDGIQSIRVGLHSARPPVTRVVVDLETARPYGLSVEGNRVLLTVLPAAVAAVSHSDSGAPGAAGVPLFGRLHRRKHGTPSVADAVTPKPVPPPPPSGPPIILTEAPSATAPSAPVANAATSRPTAAHPNRGSLQEGTVFPSLGAPGTGIVPPTVSSNSTADQHNSSTPIASIVVAQTAAKSAEAPVQQGVNQAAPNRQTTAQATENAVQPVSTPANVSSETRGPIAPAASPAVVAKMTVTAPVQAAANPVSGSATSAAPANTPAVSETMTVTAPAQAAATSAGQAATAITAAPSAPPAAPQPNPVATQISPTPAPAAGTDTPLPVLATRQPNADVRTAFKIKYVAEGAAYLDAGRSSGLSEGMKLEVHDTDPSTAQAAGDGASGVRVVAQLKIISVAETSAVAEISEPTRDVKAGDLAYLSSEDTESLVAQRSLSPTRKYPTVISFTEGDPLEEEARDEVPRPPLPEVNRARGRIGFDYSGIISHGQFASTSSNVGMVIRTDVTRIGGSYWNMSGYWRGRFMSNSGPSQPTLQDLINRTYTIGLTYDNPKSPWVAGVGRLYLPWATSLDTIDGGYIGRRVSDIATVGLFAGSTPDPTSWSYAPDQQMSGMFVNFQGGSFDDFRFSSTEGLGLQMLKWKINRPFAFIENGFYYKRYFSLYNALQADKPASNPAVASPGAGISRSFTTLRIQPFDRLEFDVNHTYFRDVPNFDPQLIGTGLLDKYLFQGFSAGPRIEVVKQIWVYATLGKSNRSGETKSSLNQLYGITFGDLPFRFHADVRYSRFNSSFGDGDYKAFSLSRNFRDNFRWEVLLGQQSYSSTLVTSNKSKFVNANIEAPLGPHYFLQGGWTVNRGGSLNYDQWFATFGYRFDSWHRGAK